MANFQNTLGEVDKALGKGIRVFAKNSIGDWIAIDAIRTDGAVRVADALSGFNDGTIGQWFIPRDMEVQ